MSGQSTYDINHPVAYAGQIYAGFPNEVISRSVETATGVSFGIIVSRGTDADKQCLRGGTTSILGVTVRTLNQEGAANTGNVFYPVESTAAVLRDGYIYAACPTGCVPGDAVNFVETTGVLDSGAAASIAETTLDDCFWDSTTAAGGIAILRVKNVENITAGS